MTTHQNLRRLVNNSRQDTLTTIKVYCYGGRYNNQNDLVNDLRITRTSVNTRLARGFTAGEVIELGQATDTNPVLLLEKFGFITSEQVMDPKLHDSDAVVVKKDVNRALRQAAQAMTQAAEACIELQQQLQ